MSQMFSRITHFLISAIAVLSSLQEKPFGFHNGLSNPRRSPNVVDQQKKTQCSAVKQRIQIDQNQTIIGDKFVAQQAHHSTSGSHGINFERYINGEVKQRFQSHDQLNATTTTELHFTSGPQEISLEHSASERQQKCESDAYQPTKPQSSQDEIIHARGNLHPVTAAVVNPFHRKRHALPKSFSIIKKLLPKMFADVFLSSFSYRHPLIAAMIVGIAHLFLNKAPNRIETSRLILGAVVARYFHFVPHGVGVGIEMGKAMKSKSLIGTLGVCLHYFGQEACFQLTKLSFKSVKINQFEMNGMLVGISMLGNCLTGSRLRETSTGYQLRGFFTRGKGGCSKFWILSFPFDIVDTLLGCQGILSATEREIVHGSNSFVVAFNHWAQSSDTVLDAHSLGTFGARTLKSMGLINSHVRLFSSPLSLGWTHGTENFCMVGDPVCGSILQKVFDPHAQIVPGFGHYLAQYMKEY